MSVGVNEKETVTLKVDGYDCGDHERLGRMVTAIVSACQGTSLRLVSRLVSVEVGPDYVRLELYVGPISTRIGAWGSSELGAEVERLTAIASEVWR